MIYVCQHYTQDSHDLRYALTTSQIPCVLIVLNDDGFLPQDAYCPFTHEIHQASEPIKPLYYNQLPVPDYWEIEGHPQQAKVLNMGVVQAVIHYAKPTHFRVIHHVDWLDPKTGALRCTDRYNQYGWRFAQTIYDADATPTHTTYYTKDKREVVVENHCTGTVIVNEGTPDKPVVSMYPDRIAFIQANFKTQGFALEQLIYNSLGEPFLVAYGLPRTTESDILVWQEPIDEEVPGNMRLILNGQMPRPTRVLVQQRSVYERLMGLIPSEQQTICHYVGKRYPIKARHQFSQTILIYTNSDQIEHIDTLIQHLPTYQFHIAALTEMSSRLLALQAYSNVHLYANVSRARIEQLNQACAIYLDINHYDEILTAVRRAFEHEMLIMSFEETAHERAYVLESLLFKSEEVGNMIAMLKQIETDKTLMSQLLAQQYAQSDHQSQEAYQQAWERANERA